MSLITLAINHSHIRSMLKLQLKQIMPPSCGWVAIKGLSCWHRIGKWCAAFPCKRSTYFWPVLCMSFFGLKTRIRTAQHAWHINLCHVFNQRTGAIDQRRKQPCVCSYQALTQPCKLWGDAHPTNQRSMPAYSIQSAASQCLIQHQTHAYISLSQHRFTHTHCSTFRMHNSLSVFQHIIDKHIQFRSNECFH